jgi:hypothetical protein
VWAILSYALASLLSIFFASVALRSEQPKANASFLQPISAHPNAYPNAYPTAHSNMHVSAPPVLPTLPATMPNMAAKTPGYYILDPYATPAHPRYIYYGPEPPGITQAAN